MPSQEQHRTSNNPQQTSQSEEQHNNSQHQATYLQEQQTSSTSQQLTDLAGKIVIIPPGITKHIIGKGGQQITNIRNKYKVKITTTARDDDETMLTIIGEKHSQEEAATEVMNLIKMHLELEDKNQKMKQQHTGHTCKYFLEGTCIYGNNCWREHPETTTNNNTTPTRDTAQRSPTITKRRHDSPSRYTIMTNEGQEEPTYTHQRELQREQRHPRENDRNLHLRHREQEKRHHHSPPPKKSRCHPRDRSPRESHRDVTTNRAPRTSRSTHRHSRTDSRDTSTHRSPRSRHSRTDRRDTSTHRSPLNRSSATNHRDTRMQRSPTNRSHRTSRRDTSTYRSPKNKSSSTNRRDTSTHRTSNNRSPRINRQDTNTTDRHRTLHSAQALMNQLTDLLNESRK